MSGEFQGIVYLGANYCLILRSERKLSVPLILRSDAQRCVPVILRSDAQHCVSKDGPESFARLAHAGAPFEAPSGRLRARGKELLRTRGQSR
jgi:hypothetical protein